MCQVLIVPLLQFPHGQRPMGLINWKVVSNGGERWRSKSMVLWSKISARAPVRQPNVQHMHLFSTKGAPRIRYIQVNSVIIRATAAVCLCLCYLVWRTDVSDYGFEQQFWVGRRRQPSLFGPVFILGIEIQTEKDGLYFRHINNYPEKEGLYCCHIHKYPE